MQQKVTAAADKVAQGYNPFTGPITDNTGVVRIKDGEGWGGDKMGNWTGTSKAWSASRSSHCSVTLLAGIDPFSGTLIFQARRSRLRELTPT